MEIRMLEKNNQVIVTGKLMGDLKQCDAFLGKSFYTTNIEIPRISGYCDIIPILVNEYYTDIIKNCRYHTFCIQGEVRSYIIQDTGKLFLFIFVKDLKTLYFLENMKPRNEIILEGYICKKPQFRITPSGYKITDIFLIINHKNGKTNYIPCICWNEAALTAMRFRAGKKIRISGRIQSREYKKIVDGNRVEKHTAVEVSINKIDSRN